MKAKPLVWTDRYNCYRTQVGVFTLAISWGLKRDERWVASFEGHRMPGDFATFHEAKAAVIAFAKRRLEQALAVLQASEQGAPQV